MAVNHHVLRLVVAFIIGIAAAFGSYHWITDTERASRRANEEAIVFASRDILRTYVPDRSLEISDPLNRIRDAGKVYLFPVNDGWELSGHYRRQNEKDWHAFLISVDANAELISLSVQDTDEELTSRASSDPRFSTLN